MWIAPIAFDFAVAAIIIWFLGQLSGLEYWPGTIVLFATIVALQFVAALYGAIKHWILFLIFDRERVARHFNRALYEKEMPRAFPFEDTMEYLARVQSDEDSSMPQRLNASFTMGEMSGVKALKPLTSYLMILFSFDRALRRYD
ncbi:hypothetical protein C1M53_31545 [Mesorhizobium sp. Pch-S]|nr:hypothetical protein C1M53_31545 [Mesorhizobium sp. Pch-S]